MKIKQLWRFFGKFFIVKMGHDRIVSEKITNDLDAHDNYFRKSAFKPGHLKPEPFYFGKRTEKEQKILTDLFLSLRSYCVDIEDLK